MKFSLASLVVIAALACTSCGKNASKSGADSTAVDSLALKAASIDYNGQIVYIQLDSLMRGYGMAVDLHAAFSDKQSKANAELEAKGRSLERDARDYQDKMQKGLLTRFEASSVESGLQKRQQETLAYRDQMSQQLGEEEAVMLNKISTAIMDYIRKYNLEKKYSMILTTTGSAPVLVADPALNITADVLAGLNEEYLAAKKIEAKK